jgi:hypothetical protein
VAVISSEEGEMRTFIIALLMTVLLVACERHDPGLKSQKEPPTVTTGRYTIHIQSPPSTVYLLLDSVTGKTWLLSPVAGKFEWKVVPGGPTGDDPLGIR